MRHKHRQQKSSWGAIGGVGLIVVAIVLGALTIRPRHSLAPTTNTDPTAVTITTSDGVALAATVKFPSGTAAAPAIIFTHEYGRDRHEWDGALDAWVQAGYIVLSYDMRGFGESRIPTIPASQDDHLRSLPLDIPAVLAYLKTLPRTDTARISMIGVGVGGDVAWVAAGSNEGLSRVAVIAPQDAAVLDGTSVTNFTPMHILVLPLAMQSTTWQQRVTVNKSATDVTVTALSAAATASSAITDAAVLDSVRTWITK